MRGTIHTPAFMPVGTIGTSQAMYLDQVLFTGAGSGQYLSSAVRRLRRNQLRRPARADPLAAPILTGGFQVMSLSGLRKLDEQGRHLQENHIDGSLLTCRRNARSRIRVYSGSDIQMQLDECVALPCEPRRSRAMKCRFTGPSAASCSRHAARQRCSASSRAA
jgi:queuine tRNA-ribosyltransferase